MFDPPISISYAIARPVFDSSTKTFPYAMNHYKNNKVKAPDLEHFELFTGTAPGRKRQSSLALKICEIKLLQLCIKILTGTQIYDRESAIVARLRLLSLRSPLYSWHKYKAETECRLLVQ